MTQPKPESSGKALQGITISLHFLCNVLVHSPMVTLWLQFALDGFTHQLALVKCSDSALWYVADCAWGSGTPHQPIAVQASAEDESTGDYNPRTYALWL